MSKVTNNLLKTQFWFFTNHNIWNQLIYHGYIQIPKTYLKLNKIKNKSIKIFFINCEEIFF